MRSFPWNSLIGTATPEGVPFKRLLLSNSEIALFEGEGASVIVIDAQEPAESVLNRYREASFLNNEHLVRVQSAGVLEEPSLVYAVTEPVEHTVAHYISKRPLPEEDAKDLADQIADGLAYLHSENLVFCNVRPETVWRSGATWKLGDFSQLRLAEPGQAKELRAALARGLDLPPEAYEGKVSPAWDVWSLGALLRRVLVPEPLHVEGAISTPRGRQMRNADLPAPFDEIARDCLEPDPNDRITLAAVRERLHGNTTGPSPTRWVAGAAEPRPKPRGLTRPAVIGLAVLGGALVLGIVASQTNGSKPEQSRTLPRPVPIAVSEADRPETPEPQPAVAAPKVSREQANREIRALLDQYVASTKARNVRSNLNLYAPFMETFYLRQKITQDQLGQEKKRQFQGISKVYRYNIDNVQVSWPRPDAPIVSFDKHWSFGDRNPFAGAERAQLELRKIEGAWKIVSEREIKVYWTRHGRIQPGQPGPPA